MDIYVERTLVKCMTLITRVANKPAREAHAYQRSGKDGSGSHPRRSTLIVAVCGVENVFYYFALGMKSGLPFASLSDAMACCPS